MSDTCVEMYHCGAVYPGWLSGGHPSVKDGAVVRRVCFNGYYGCCHLFTYISVRNCGGFYVYKLTPLHTSSNCYCRYCASNGTALVLPKTLTTEISTSSTAQATTKPPTKLSLSSTVQTATEPLTIFVTELSTSSTAQTTGTPTTFVKEFSTSSTSATTTKPLINLSFSSTVQTATEPLTTFLTEITTSSTVQTTTRTPPKLSTSSTAQTTTEPPTRSLPTEECFEATQFFFSKVDT
ncbi:salivary glue protein Sgs-3-like isoform X2 [Montipora capricornis]|uniref:salivary glue protein Sgs-3-like isoform X2 n=1 Tax=Montipora capricornis TaxID=246305 RepID=UPI0035F1E7F4